MMITCEFRCMFYMPSFCCTHLLVLLVSLCLLIGMIRGVSSSTALLCVLNVQIFLETLSRILQQGSYYQAVLDLCEYISTS